MKKTHFLVAVSVIVALNTPYPIGVATLLAFWGWWKTQRKVWILVILAVLLHPHLKSGLPHVLDGVVSELNDKSALVTSGNQKILIPSLDSVCVGDRLIFREITPIEASSAPGDRGWMDYVHLHDLVGTVSEEAIVSVKRTALMQWWVDQWSQNELFLSLVRKLLFQSDPLGEWGLIAGTGLVYALIHRSLGTLFSGVLRESVNSSVRLMMWIGLAVILGYPLSLLRFVVSLLTGWAIQDRWKRWAGSIFAFWLLDPSLLTSMTILIPLFFQAFGLFKRDVGLRGVGFTLFQGVLWHRVSPLITLGYPLWRKAMVIWILCLGLGTLLPGVQPWVVEMVLRLESLMRELSEFWVLRGQVTVPFLVVLGLVWRMTLWTPRLRAAWLLAVTVYLPALSAPWLASVTVIDVGQGNAILLSSPLNQSVVLIDTGRSFALRQVTETMDRMGISRLDAVILTHDDADHAENYTALSTDYRVLSLVTSARDVALKNLVLVALDASVSSPNDNQQSLVYGLKWGSTRFLFTGDAEMTNESALISRYPDLWTDVLVVGHHGSAGSTSSEWLGTLQPRLAIISVGDNTYGHPSLKMLERLRAFHIPYLTTRQEGNLRFILIPWGTILITDSWKLKVLR